MRPLPLQYESEAADHRILVQWSDSHLEDLRAHCRQPKAGAISASDLYGRQPLPEPHISPMTSNAALCVELDSLGAREANKIRASS